MPVSTIASKKILDGILKNTTVSLKAEKLKSRPVRQEPLPPHLPRETVMTIQAQQERLMVLGKQGIKFQYLIGEKRIESPEVFAGNIESYIGLAQVPVAVIGPLRVNGLNANGDFYVPLATTEGAMTASYQRGAMAISLSGGATAICTTDQISRAPAFVFANAIQAGKFIAWCVKHFNSFRKVASSTTSHGVLEDMRVTMLGNQVFLKFEYTTGDASGQNMVTIASDAVCRFILAKCKFQPMEWFLESNLSGDKKATALSFTHTRGKKVTAEAFINRKLFTRVFHTTPETLLQYCKVSYSGGVQSGSIGAQGHYANGLTALFIACGQDAACVAEAAVGITRFDVTAEGDAYVNVTLPNLIVGTVGGGTGLPTQRECLEMLGCTGAGTARKFAEICAATVMAGELSITAALAAGDFCAAHKAYVRNVNKKYTEVDAHS
jgi:hydroxymethylglutaryl-CoA reductase (NADPH)